MNNIPSSVDSKSPEDENKISHEIPDVDLYGNLVKDETTAQFIIKGKQLIEQQLEFPEETQKQISQKIDTSVVPKNFKPAKP